jgi:DNA polymerase I-like protein with 3'-5' exonuclease and polymerase domains
LRDIKPIIQEKYHELYSQVGQEFNIRSIIELPPIFDKLGIDYPRTEKGNPSITKNFLAEHGHPICKLISSIRVYENISNNFIKKLLDIQEYTGYTNNTHGRIHPELKLFGAAATGRFSCVSPNIQQIPKRDKVLGPICRGLVVAEEGERFYSLDFSSQEIRLQIHYASLHKCPGANQLVQAYNEDPKTDLHRYVQDLCGIDRDQAKIINFGLSYGMGGAKLCRTLNLPTRRWKPPRSNTTILVAGSEGKQVIQSYHEACPYLNILTRIYEERMKSKNFVKTIGGRILRRGS